MDQGSSGERSGEKRRKEENCNEIRESCLENRSVLEARDAPHIYLTERDESESPGKRYVYFTLLNGCYLMDCRCGQGLGRAQPGSSGRTRIREHERAGLSRAKVHFTR